MKNRTKAIAGLTACCALLCAAASLTACHEHVWGTGEVTAPAKCGAAGEMTYTCDCGETKTEVIPALEHAWDEGNTTAPASCTAEGEKTFTCTRDGCSETKTEPIEKTEHSYGEWILAQPDMKNEGKAVKTCTADGCGAKKEEILPALDDKNYTVTEDTSDCTNAGTARFAINVNGTGFAFTANVPAKGHVEKWFVVQEPTQTIAGTAKKCCENCTHDFGETEELPVLTADNAGEGGYYVRSKVDPTCTKDGKFVYEVAQDKADELFGGAKFTAFEDTNDAEVRATGHDYEVVKVAGNAGEKGTATKTCKSCHIVEIYRYDGDMPAGGLAESMATVISRGKYNLVNANTTQASYWYKFKVTEAGIYKFDFTFLSDPTATTSGQVYFYEMKVGSSKVLNTNKGSAVYNTNTNKIWVDRVAIACYDCEETPTTPKNYTVKSFTIDIASDYIDSYLIFNLKMNGGVDFIINVDIPDETAPEPLPTITESANTVNFAEIGVAYDNEFTSETEKKYTITVPEGVSAGIERENGSFKDLLTDGGTANFKMAAGETVIFSFRSSTDGDKTITIAENTSAGDGIDAGTLSSDGSQTTVVLYNDSVTTFGLPDDLEDGTYTLTFGGNHLFNKSAGAGGFYFKLNGEGDWDQDEMNSSWITMRDPASGTVNGCTYTCSGGQWTMTLTLTKTDKLCFAPFAVTGQSDSGNLIGEFYVTMTPAT